ncbi:hypothetical protein EDF62_0010 [Leucobacter luti]|uniref:Uncharacterized protein n=1 Tax=Leucobacter luti TaxID=340320 RepID=A0A4R6S8Y3_9MICO|nr:hypothetical protein [Leucobacter luti]TDP95335.1 hypothetical protein EDF62_0010 [Leucobacter luti]
MPAGISILLLARPSYPEAESSRPLALAIFAGVGWSPLAAPFQPDWDVEPVPALESCTGFLNRESALTREPLGADGRGHAHRAIVTAFSAPLAMNMANQLTVGAWLAHPD